MKLTKQEILIGLILIQSVFIVVFVFEGISLRNEWIAAKTEAAYYKKAYLETPENENAALRELLDESKELLREAEIMRGNLHGKDKI